MKSFKTEIYTLDVLRLSAIYGERLKYGTIEDDTILNLDGDICYKSGERARVLEINGDDYILESEGKFILTKEELIASQIKNLENSMKRTMEHDLIAQGYTQDEVKRIVSSRSQKKAIKKPIQNKRLIKNGTANYWQDMDEFPIVIYEADVSDEEIKEMREANGYDESVSDDEIRGWIEEDTYSWVLEDCEKTVDDYNYDFHTIKAEIKSGYYDGLQLIFSELDGDTLYDYYDEDGNETEEFKRDREEDIQKGNELINKLVGYGWEKLSVLSRSSNGEAVYTRLDNACGKKKGKKKAIKSELEEESDDEEVHMNTAADRQWAEEKKLANARNARRTIKPITNANTDGIKAQMEYTLESCRDFAEDHCDGWDGSDAQAVKCVLDDVVRVKGRDGRIRGNIQEAIADWLMGLPMNIAFENYEILQLGEKWGYLPKVDYNSGDYTRKEAQWVENWFMGIANNILKLARKFKVETPMPSYR